jgi:hypothetical protein
MRPFEEKTMNKHHALMLALAGAFVSTGCGKTQQAVTEKVIETSMSKDGTQAKVNLSEGGMKITTTDAAGKATQMEIGGAQVSEADLGVPFYPGSKPAEGGSMRMVASGSSNFQVGMHSDDAPDKVAEFYREKLKAMADGKQLMDMSSNDGAALTLVDEKAKHTLQVSVSKAEKGSDIAIMSSRSSEK